MQKASYVLQLVMTAAAAIARLRPYMQSMYLVYAELLVDLLSPPHTGRHYAKDFVKLRHQPMLLRYDLASRFTCYLRAVRWS